MQKLKDAVKGVACAMGMFGALTLLFDGDEIIASLFDGGGNSAGVYSAQVSYPSPGSSPVYTGDMSNTWAALDAADRCFYQKQGCAEAERLKEQHNAQTSAAAGVLAGSTAHLKAQNSINGHKKDIEHADKERQLRRVAEDYRNASKRAYSLGYANEAARLEHEAKRYESMADSYRR